MLHAAQLLRAGTSPTVSSSTMAIFSASLRETAEELMRDEEQAQTTVTTSTLELGIDIGRLERAFQIDAPFTVSSFLQRMGRTGRRDLPPEMWFVMREEEPEPRTMMPETIP